MTIDMGAFASRRGVIAGGLALAAARSTVLATTGALAQSPVELRFSRYGGVADGSIRGTGTDNRAAIQKMFDDAVAAGSARIIFDRPGSYAFSGQLSIMSATLRDIVLEMDGVELVSSAPTSRRYLRYLRVENLRDEGGSVTIRGGTIGMGRPCGRYDGLDMVLLQGFRSVDVQGLTVPCSDNMGLSVQRDFRGRVPEQVIIRDTRIGGRSFDAPHDYGSIGDTGIYLPNGAWQSDIDVVVRSSGDDAVYLGPIPPGANGRNDINATSFRLNVDTQDTICGAKVELSNGTITGHIRNTGSAGIDISPSMDGAAGVNRADNIKVQCIVEDPGQMEAGDAGRLMILKRNPFGVWIYGSANNIDLGTTRIVRSRDSAISLQATARDQISNVRGAPLIENCCVNRDGTPISANRGLIHRSPTGGGTVRGVDLTPSITNCAQPVVQWVTSSAQDDSGISIQARLARYRPGMQNGVPRAIGDVDASGAGNVRDMRLAFAGADAAVSRKVRLGARIMPSDVGVRVDQSTIDDAPDGSTPGRRRRRGRPAPRTGAY